MDKDSSKVDQSQDVGPAQAVPDNFAPIIKALDQLQGQVHEVAVGMGRWEDEPTELELHALMHTDLAKATVDVANQLPLYNFTELEPTGELVELADCVLHILDYCGSLNISLAQILIRKHIHDKRMIERKRRA